MEKVERTFSLLRFHAWQDATDDPHHGITLETDAIISKQILNENKHTRQPLGRSSLENGPTCDEGIKDFDEKKRKVRKYHQAKELGSPPSLAAITAPRQGIAASDANRPSRHINREKIATHKLKEDRSIREGDDTHLHGYVPESLSSGQLGHVGSNNEAEQRIKELERKMMELQRAKEIYERKCSDLEGENEKLKKSVKQALAQSQSQWTTQDEEYFQKCREARIEDQTLVKRTFRSHLHRLNEIYDIKNQWCKTDKPHFDLTLPSHFQRATALDIRDKEWEGREAETSVGQANYAPIKAERERKSSPTVKTFKPKRSIKSQPSPLRALKKLTMNF